MGANSADELEVVAAHTASAGKNVRNHKITDDEALAAFRAVQKRLHNR